MKKIIIIALVLVAVAGMLYFKKFPLSNPNYAVIRVHVGEMGSALGLSIKPQGVLEDSRCPQDVQCVWAGTTKIKTDITSAKGTNVNIFEPGMTITTEAESITLSAVNPYPKIAGQIIETQDYEFVFTVVKR